MAGSWELPGSAPRLFVAGAVPLLRAEEQVFEAMLEGWRDQQLSRKLNHNTIDDRLRPTKVKATLAGFIKGPADTVPTATATEADPSSRVRAQAMA